MKIRVLRNLGRGLPDFTEGQVVDVADEVAQALIDRFLAEAIEPKLKAVPPEPQLKAVPDEGSVEKATADVESYRDKVKGKKKANGAGEETA